MISKKEEKVGPPSGYLAKDTELLLRTFGALTILICYGTRDHDVGTGYFSRWHLNEETDDF